MPRGESRASIDAPRAACKPRGEECALRADTALVRIAALVACVAAPFTATAEPAAEKAYAAFVREAAAIAQKGRTPTGNVLWVADVSRPEDARRVLAPLSRARAALAAAPDGEKPKALELEARLEELASALAVVASLPVNAPAIVRARVQLEQDGGGWDSVVWEGRAHPKASGSLSFRFRSRPEFVPGAAKAVAGAAHLPLACPNAAFEAVNPALVDEASAELERYLTDARLFVEGAMRAAGRAALPKAIVVLERPEPGHVRAVEPGPDGLPFGVKLVTVREWAGRDVARDEAPRAVREFREEWARLQREDRDRNHLANCALMMQALVVDVLGPAWEAAAARRQDTRLAPHRTQFAAYPLELRSGAEPGAPVVARVARASAVEILEGLSLDLDSGRPRYAPVIRVRAGGHEGWVDTSRALRWLTAGRVQSEPRASLVPEPPPSAAELFVELERLASATVLADQTARHYASARTRDKASESLVQSKGTRDELCRLEADFVAQVGQAALDAQVSAWSARRIESGDPARRVKAEVSYTFGDARCGPAPDAR